MKRPELLSPNRSVPRCQLLPWPSLLLPFLLSLSPLPPALAAPASSLVQSQAAAKIGQTEILKWPLGKRAAVSITYDGGTINQFRVALPIMNRLRLPATFFIVTGDITGSRYPGRFLGRPFADILRESAAVPVDQTNLFERATALHFCLYQGANDYHTRAGDLYELGKFDDACKRIEEAYAKIRAGELKPLAAPERNKDVDISWTELKQIAAQGHEFASHSITHPQFALLNAKNLDYELENSRKEILTQLGPKHIFSHECPYGTQNPLVLAAAQHYYRVLRNHMPDPFLEEINRWNKNDPGASAKAYVQWQRGPKADTPVEQMKSWIDTCLARDNIWLVLVFHGVDGIGYQPKTGKELKDLFEYLKSNDGNVWVATFQDATKYIRERMRAKLSSAKTWTGIKVSLSHTLNKLAYNLPLTLKTCVPLDWVSVEVRQGDKILKSRIKEDSTGRFVLYEAWPNTDPVRLTSR
jgi:peptidoglycan/xylan/chitin deacetylase (PgdA/CDA1 family)